MTERELERKSERERGNGSRFLDLRPICGE